MEPPSIQKYRIPKARLTNKNRKEINEYGLTIPSKNSKNYEPNIHEHAMLWNSGTLPGSKAFNYRNNAKTKRNAARRNYMEQRAKLAALPPVTPKKNNVKKNNTKKNNNGTRRALF